MTQYTEHNKQYYVVLKESAMYDIHFKGNIHSSKLNITNSPMGQYFPVAFIWMVTF